MPIIRFVPEVEHVPDNKKNGNSSTVKFKILSTVKKTYKVLVDGGTEAFINHIKIHNTLADCKVKEEVVVARSLIIANRRKIASLTVADPAANQAEIENLVNANRELTETVRTLQNSSTSPGCKVAVDSEGRSPPLSRKVIESPKPVR